MANLVFLIGRLCADPQMKATDTTAIANFTLAVDRPLAKEKTADFIRIVAFGKTAEFIEKYFFKGKQIAIQGRIQERSYEDKNGDRRSITEVVAEKVEFVGAKDEGKKESVMEGFQAIEEDDFPPF